MLLSTIYPSYYYRPVRGGGSGQQTYLNEEHSQQHVPLMHLQQQQQNPTHVFAPPPPEPIEESDTDSEIGEVSILRIVVSYAFFLAFISLVIYALYVSDVPEVSNACGSSLWSFVFARLCVAVFEATLVVCFGYYSVIVENSPAPVEGTTYSTCVTVFIHVTFIGAGAFYVSEAMNVESCRNALSSVSATKSPLLGILGYIYVAMDSFVVTALLFMMCFILSTRGLISH